MARKLNSGESANPDSHASGEGSAFWSMLSGGRLPIPPMPQDPGKAEALVLIKSVHAALVELREAAHEALDRCEPESAESLRHRGHASNYGALAELLNQAELALGGAQIG